LTTTSYPFECGKLQGTDLNKCVSIGRGPVEKVNQTHKPEQEEPVTARKAQGGLTGTETKGAYSGLYPTNH
jgi:hypothetical protein